MIRYEFIKSDIEQCLDRISTIPNLIFGEFSVTSKLILIGGAIRLTGLLFVLSVLSWPRDLQNGCNELGGNMARFTQFPIMITRSTIIYEIISPGAAGSSIYV